MPTAMEYAINKIIELSTELANIKARTGCSTADMNEIMGFHTQSPDCDGIDEEEKKVLKDDWELLMEMEVETICEYLAAEHSYHLYKKGGKGEPPTAIELEKLKVSADLIAEAQEKRIRLLEDDKKERMEDREKLLKRIRELEDAETKLKADINTYQIQLHQLSDIMLRDKKKKPQLSPCMEDPITINGTLQP